MKLSDNGAMEIVSHEGICLEPYLDSVGVWTIGIGQTAFDGFNPRTTPKLTLEGAISLFKRKIVVYTKAVDALNREWTQSQYDALVSFCYNVGEGNLRKLCKNRSAAQIGDAIMLYQNPPEIIKRRLKEQNLYKRGVYTNTGKALVFPVRNSKPRYSEGYMVDLRPYFASAQVAQAEPKPSKPSITNPAKGGVVAWFAALFNRKG